MARIEIGGKIWGKKILEVVPLSDGTYVVKTEDSKSEMDFRVKHVVQTRPRIRSVTPKHAHFAVDFYGKLCANHAKAVKVLESIVDVWNGASVREVLERNRAQVSDLPGYSLEYILYALNWILDQEDVNFRDRPNKKQEEIDEILRGAGIPINRDRLGSQLAMSLFCNIALGVHPVEALLQANLDIIPAKRARGAV